jgi:hypothetical protein
MRRPTAARQANSISDWRRQAKQATAPKRKQLRNVMTGQSLCAAAPLELRYANSQRRENFLSCRHIFHWVSAGTKTRESKQQLHFRQYQI